MHICLAAVLVLAACAARAVEPTPGNAPPGAFTTGRPRLGVNYSLDQPNAAVSDFQPLPPIEEIAPGEANVLPPESVVPPSVAAAPESSRRRRGGMHGPGGGNWSPFSFKTFWAPAADAESQPGSFTYTVEQLDVAIPRRVMPPHTWLGTATVEHMGVGSNIVLPDSGITVPDDLWRVNVGTTYIQQLGDDWAAGGSLQIGTASDDPFGAFRDITFSGVAFLNVPSGEHDAWNFSLFYSPTSQLPFPLPGIAYVWRPTDAFTMNIGLPFSLEYHPTETTTISLAYVPLTNVKAMVRQRLGEAWTLYGGYQTVTETFFLSERTNDDERLYIYDQRLLLGLRRELGGGFCLDLSTAYLFGRELFQAESFGRDHRDQVDIEPGLGAMLQIQWQPRGSRPL